MANRATRDPGRTRPVDVRAAKAAAYEIPPDLRSWVEATAPKCTTDDWAALRDERDPSPGSVIDGITYEQARALLAYADEVAVGLRNELLQVLCDEVAGVNPPWIHVRIYRELRRRRLFDPNGITDYGRYIAGRAAALRGDS